MEKKKTGNKTTKKITKSTVKKPTKTVVKKEAPKTNKKNKKKKGFTLIELLAVIIILGILMIIAIPSVTKYISDSRKSAYVDTAKEIVAGTRNTVNEGKLGMYSTDTTYYIPFDYIKSENGTKSPYGEFVYAYVGVIYDGKGYTYYWISVDDAGQGVDEVTPAAILNEDDIKSDINALDIKQKVDSTGIGGRKKVLVLENGEWVTKTENAQNNIPEEGGSSSGGENTPTAAETISQVSGLVTNAGAKRYVGSNPNNYVSFNNGQLWRIIGVYGNQLKIISSENGFRQKYNDTYNNNIWADSLVETALNGTYYDGLSDTAKQMIAEGTWHIGKLRNNIDAPTAYTAAQSDTWNGKVALLATYEFMYATDDSSCYSVTGANYAYVNQCGNPSKNWLVPTNPEWTINSDSRSDYPTVMRINNLVGYISDAYSPYNTATFVYPVVYLKSSVKITDGTGTSGDPYILG